MATRKKIDCLIIGDCFYDVTVNFSAYNKAVKTGGAIEADKISVLPGGIGNVANVISRLGGTTCFLGMVGDDVLGRSYIDDVKGNSIIPIIHKSQTHSTGVLLALLSNNAERSFLVSRGANDCLVNQHVSNAFDKFNPNLVFISGYSLTQKPMEKVLLQSIELANRNNSKIMFDCTPFNLVKLKQDLFMRIISKSYCTCLNYLEASSLVGSSRSESIVKVLREIGCFFALTLGSLGCILVTSCGVKRIAAKRVSVKDTNGAGDCFNGAIAYGISRNLSPLEMGRLGVRLAAIKVQHYGPRVPSGVTLSYT